jgi:hypothetical protein
MKVLVLLISNPLNAVDAVRRFGPQAAEGRLPCEPAGEI